jgi:hypothetical protein
VRAWPVVLLVACVGCSADASSTSAVNTAQPAHDAGDGFGNAAGNSAARHAMLTLIDDGGAGVLPDGAVVYLALWARPCPRDSTLSYESFGRDFFQSYCLRCHSEQNTDRHGAPAGVNFDALDGIRAHEETIWALAADDNTAMPEAGTAPSLDERRSLGDWLACGAKSALDAASAQE